LGRTGLVLGLIVLLVLGASQLAIGEKPAKFSAAAEADLTTILKQSEILLAKLEYERCREILEEAARDSRYRKAKQATRARLWAELGRARAELGDSVGMDEAFIEAVRLDRKVKLGKSTSPKILAALERARQNAPPEEEPEPRAEEEPSRDAGVAPSPPAETAQDAGTKEPVAETKSEKKPPKPPKTEKPPEKKPPEKIVLTPRINGQIVSMGRVELVVEANVLPKNARIEARIKRTGAQRYELVPMVRTGTIARIELKLDHPRFEIYFEAKIGEAVIARAASNEAPLIIEPRGPPGIHQAWSQPQAMATGTSTPTSTSTVALVSAPIAEDGGPELGETEILIIAGAVVAAALVTTAVVVILTSRSGACEAPEGFGCTEIRVLPLFSF
jgi:hypothetical protein